ncbi:MAG TPA: pilus assembly PilX N-terminal domain-containing protein, partial [Blastocatellia bacterium]|nr:pilus assembly PilX N-terminal domain-containing protein [Blastocatellia bacterium]
MTNWQRDYFAATVFGPAETERGMALVTVMLVMSLMLMLGLAVTFTALSDNSVTSNFKNETKGFYAAEAGVHDLHRLIHSDQFVLGSLPNPASVTPGMPTLNAQSFTSAAQNLLKTTEYFPNDAQYNTTVLITDIVTPFPASDNNPAHAGTRVTYVNPQHPEMGQIEPYAVKYKLDSVGHGVAGLNGTVTLEELGAVTFNLLTSSTSGGFRVGSFAEFALFADHFDPYHPEGGFLYQGFGPGDRFSGRVHTNERF